ncbi:MAG: protein disulfide oxidoreductase [Sulfurimonas sp.]|nr:protein disulfide oxidoreductase [Sulfurimonas sp.]
MLQKLKYYLKEILLFTIILLVFANALSIYKSFDLNKQNLSLRKITLLHNNEYVQNDTKPLLVHFWATWCPTCRVEAPNIQYLSKYYEVLTIAVKSGSDKEIQVWMDENKYDFNVVNDSSSLIASNYKIGVFPTSLIYDKNKSLVFSDVGYTSTWGLFLRMWWATL